MISLGRVFPITLSAAALLAFVAGCGSGGDSAQNADGGNNSGVGDLPVAEVPARWASGNARDIRTLIASSGTVIIGEVVALNGQRTEQVGRETTTPESAQDSANTAGGRANTSFPISEYQVVVRRSFTGGLAEGASLTLEQPGGVITRTDGTQARLMLEGDDPFEVGQTYLIFGSMREDGVLTTTPFGRFLVDNTSLAPLDEWAHLPVARQLAGMSVEDAAREVQNAR